MVLETGFRPAQKSQNYVLPRNRLFNLKRSSAGSSSISDVELYISAAASDFALPIVVLKEDQRSIKMPIDCLPSLMDISQ